MEFDVQSERPPDRRLSGRAVIVGLFVFGFLLTGLLWLYWALHVAPFRPLQDALAAEIRDSSPRVDGGQRRMHKGTPHILRITLRVPFDPVTDTRRAEATLDRIEAVARQKIDLDSYDELEVHMFQGIPEKGLVQQEYRRNLRSSRP